MAAIISVIPIILLFVLMMGFKVSGWKSALTTLVVTILLALFAAPSLGIVPEKYANVSIHSITLWSVVEGFLKACFPIMAFRRPPSPSAVSAVYSHSHRRLRYGGAGW